MCVIGEWWGDTGTPAFTAALCNDFLLTQRLPLPNWSDTAHELTVWERKARSAKKKGKGKQAYQAQLVRPQLELLEDI